MTETLRLRTPREMQQKGESERLEIGEELHAPLLALKMSRARGAGVGVLQLQETEFC